MFVVARSVFFFFFFFFFSFQEWKCPRPDCGALNDKGKYSCLSCGSDVSDEEDLEEIVGMKASSPDDEALVCFSNFIGVEFYSLTPPHIEIRVKPPAELHYHFEK